MPHHYQSPSATPGWHHFKFIILIFRAIDSSLKQGGPNGRIGVLNEVFQSLNLRFTQTRVGQVYPLTPLIILKSIIYIIEKEKWYSVHLSVCPDEQVTICPFVCPTRHYHGFVRRPAVYLSVDFLTRCT